MAEFQEMIRQKGRMCTELNNCNGCPIDLYFGSCVQINPQNAAKYEELVMKWAKENPEPKYPTWIEWQQKEFLGATTMICPKIFMSKEEANCMGKSCYECTHSPIPKKIAEKLGLKKE